MEHEFMVVGDDPLCQERYLSSEQKKEVQRFRDTCRRLVDNIRKNPGEAENYFCSIGYKIQKTD